VRIPGADHYFTGRLDELREAVRGYYQSGPGAQLLARV
jgi:alpha/beta superfamily hydrolase